MFFNEDEYAHKLLARIQEDDTKALDTLYTYSGKKLHRLALRKGLPHEDAEDAVQETFVRIMERIETYKKERRSGWHWILVIFYNIVNDKFRKFKQEVKWFDKNLSYEKFIEILSKEPDLDELIWRKEEHAALENAWKSLSYEDQLIINSKGKRGPAGRRWKEASTRFYNAFRMCLYKH